jgi:histone H1/5
MDPAAEPAPPSEPGAVTEVATSAEPTRPSEPGAATETAETESKPADEQPKKGETESKSADEQPKKEKKPRTPRKKRTAPTHPPYFEMIKEAITALDVKTGSSPYAIAKFIGEKHKDELPSNYKKVLAVQLKNFAAKGKLVKIRASFKLPSSEEKKKPMEKEIKTPTKARSKRKAPAPKENTKKKSSRPSRAKKAKKAAAAPKPKQPKSIKSGGTKKANKAVPA